MAELLRFHGEDTDDMLLALEQRAYILSRLCRESDARAAEQRRAAIPADRDSHRSYREIFPIDE